MKTFWVSEGSCNVFGWVRENSCGDMFLSSQNDDRPDQNDAQWLDCGAVCQSACSTDMVCQRRYSTNTQPYTLTMLCADIDGRSGGDQMMLAARSFVEADTNQLSLSVGTRMDK